MTATTQPENGTIQRDSISLPLLRPVSRPPTTQHPVTPANGADRPSAPAPNTPPAVQSVQKLNLDLVGNGDKVVLRTANSTYNLEMGENLRCKVIPGKSGAKGGEATLMGGTNVDATEYTPNRILVGGRAAYQFADDEAAVLTSVIESIFWVPAKAASKA